MIYSIDIYILDLLDASRQDRRRGCDLVFGVIALQRDLQVLKVFAVESGIGPIERMGQLLQEAGIPDPE